MKNETTKAAPFREVTRSEYLEFISRYPNKLEFDCTGICEPPLGTHNDFSDGKVWPESVVAKELRDWIGENGERDNTFPGKFWRYFVRQETPN